MVSPFRRTTVEESLAKHQSPNERQVGAFLKGIAGIANFGCGSQFGGISEFASEGVSEPDNQCSLFKFSPSLPSMIGHRFA
jgi:hypothetical protein